MAVTIVIEWSVVAFLTTLFVAKIVLVQCLQYLRLRKDEQRQIPEKEVPVDSSSDEASSVATSASTLQRRQAPLKPVKKVKEVTQSPKRKKDKDLKKPLCPLCGHLMKTVRNPRGGLFWGCTEYKKSGCHGSRSLNLSTASLVDDIRRLEAAAEVPVSD